MMWEVLVAWRASVRSWGRAERSPRRMPRPREACGSGRASVSADDSSRRRPWIAASVRLPWPDASRSTSGDSAMQTPPGGARPLVGVVRHQRPEGDGVVGVVGVVACVEDGDAGGLGRRLVGLEAEQPSGEDAAAKEDEEGRCNVVARKRYPGGKNGGDAGEDPAHTPSEGAGGCPQDPGCG